MATTRSDRSILLSTSDPNTRRKLYRFIRSLPVGEYSVDFKKKRDRMRDGQRGYYWAYLTPEIGRHLGYSREQIDRILCTRFLRDSWAVKDKPYTVVLGLSDLDHAKAELFFYRVRRWAVDELGLRLRMPEEYTITNAFDSTTTTDCPDQ